VLRQGPVSALLHGLVEYVEAALLIAAPFLFGFDSDSARAVSIVTGVGLIVVAATTDYPLGLSRTLMPGIHVVLDLALVGLLIAAPFLFGFSDEGAPTAFFIVLGVFHLLLTLATRFLPSRADEKQRRGRLQSPS
jgi:hypothetical protein